MTYTLCYAYFKLTFSLTTSPVSFTCAFVFPLTGLLHSTRGSWRKVFKTLNKFKKKGLDTYNTFDFQDKNTDRSLKFVLNSCIILYITVWHSRTELHNRHMLELAYSPVVTVLDV